MDRLEHLKNDWEFLAKADAMGAILTDATKSGGKWNSTEFFNTGTSEIETIFRHITTLGLQPDAQGRALDFGCGVGRLTQALARRFQSCVGIDISQQMIDQANELNLNANCSYLVNAASQLPFEDASFTFIYSNIVLQHVPRPFAIRYLNEFVRVLAPGGVLIFGVQDSFATPDLASALTRLRHVLHLKSRVRTWLRRPGGDMQMHCLPQKVVRKALAPATIVDIRYTNTAAKDFNGKLVYLDEAPRSGYVGRQYCVTKRV